MVYISMLVCCQISLLPPSSKSPSVLLRRSWNYISQAPFVWIVPKCSLLVRGFQVGTEIQRKGRGHPFSEEFAVKYPSK